MSKTIMLFMTIALAIMTAVFVTSADAIAQLFPNFSGNYLTLIQLIISALSGLLSSIPIKKRNATIFAGDATAVDVPEKVYPAIWTVLSWIFSLIFKKKGV